MCEPSTVYTPSELSFCTKNHTLTTFTQEPLIAKLHEWLNTRESVLQPGLVSPEVETDLPDKALGFVEQLSNKVHSSIANKEEIRHHLSAPIASSALPLHHDYQRSSKSRLLFNV